MKLNPNNSAKISLKSSPKTECRILESFWQITEEDYENMESEYDILY